MQRLFNILLGTLLCLSAQGQPFGEADSLRGMLRPERTCYDVRFYDLAVEIDLKAHTLTGCNVMHYEVKRGFNMLQMDLFANMHLDSIVHRGERLTYYRKHDAFFVDFGQMQTVGDQGVIAIYYHGKPLEAINPPWDGGFSWEQDTQGNPWVGVSCEGVGASLWWPNKDHLSDEPDSMRIRCTIPQALYCVSNGVLRSVKQTGEQKTYEWFVHYPINNYNVTLNIGNYVHFSDTFVSPTTRNKLPLDYYVLPYHLSKAKKQFKEVQRVLTVFDQYLAPYPFWNDGYALVETSYLGMEHQGAIAYGNQYMSGYMGAHIPKVPDDFIILHETGHEWWGNSVSCNDLAEMWIHETFTTYMEMVYVEHWYDYATALEYLQAEAAFIENVNPILAPKEVNFHDHSTDIYYKGAVMLHTLRRILNDDAKWWALIKTFYQQHQLGHARTEDFIEHVQQQTGRDFGYFFDQYLKYPDLPILQIKAKPQDKDLVVRMRWYSDTPTFDMPVWLGKAGAWEQLTPSKGGWTTYRFKNMKIKDLSWDYGLFVVSLEQEE